jgi:hypothetical protein
LTPVDRGINGKFDVGGNRRYQVAVHGDDPAEVSIGGLKRAFVDSCLTRTKPEAGTDTAGGLVLSDGEKKWGEKNKKRIAFAIYEGVFFFFFGGILKNLAPFIF